MPTDRFIAARRGARRHPAEGSIVAVHAHTQDADVLSLVGELDLSTAPRLVSFAADVLRRGGRTVILDLEGVPFIDSAGLASLLNVLRRTEACGGRLVLAAVGPQVRGVLEQTRLDREFTTAQTVDVARRVLSGTL